MTYLVLFVGILKMEFILMRRYLVEFVGGLVGMYIIFLLIFFGARALRGGLPDFGDTLDAIMVGYLLFTFAVTAYNELAPSLLTEAQEGTLEQLSMSLFGLIWVCLFRVASFFIFNLILHTILLFLAMGTTGRWLHLDAVTLLTLLVLTLAGTYGIGFIMGGLALVFKRIGSLIGMGQLAMLGLIAAPIERFPFLRYLPLAEGARLIRQVMMEGLSLTQLPIGDLLLLVINSAFYLGIGLIAFNLLLKTAKNRGLLGHY